MTEKALGRVVANFVHLRVKSCYSLLEGAVRSKELAKLCTSLAMPAVAVCDNNNLFGVFDISETLANEGVQPIVGALVSVDLEPTPQISGHGMRQKPPVLPLLVQNADGYRNLVKLLSAAYLTCGPGEWPHVDTRTLAAHGKGLIALTGGPGGPLNTLLVGGQVDGASLSQTASVSNIVC